MNEILNPASVACVALLEQVLETAKAGGVTTVAVVAAGPSDFGAQIAGPDASKIMLGLAVLQDSIVRGVTKSDPTPGPRLLRPGGPLLQSVPVPKRR
jgi:hypothetical protein